MEKLFPQQMISNPTEIEQMVREQMQQRKDEHDRMNLERKLTKQQRKKKLKEKTQQQIEETGIFMNCYGMNFKDKKIIDICFHKCKELFLKGVILYTNECCVVVIEGSIHTCSKFEMLMKKKDILVKEKDFRVLEIETINKMDENQDINNLNTVANNEMIEEKEYSIQLLWKGKRSSFVFNHISTLYCDQQSSILEVLQLNNLEFVWKLFENMIA